MICKSSDFNVNRFADSESCLPPVDEFDDDKDFALMVAFENSRFLLPHFGRDLD